MNPSVFPTARDKPLGSGSPTMARPNKEITMENGTWRTCPCVQHVSIWKLLFDSK